MNTVTCGTIPIPAPAIHCLLMICGGRKKGNCCGQEIAFEAAQHLNKAANMLWLHGIRVRFVEAACLGFCAKGLRVSEMRGMGEGETEEHYLKSGTVEEAKAAVDEFVAKIKEKYKPT